MTYSFPDLEPVCSMSSSNYCFLTCIQISQEAVQVVWYSHLFQNFPQLVVIHTVKGFGIVNNAEIDVFLEISCLFGNLISGSSAFSKTSLNIWKFMFHVLKPGLENFERDVNTRPPELPLEKSVCRSGSNCSKWTWNNRLVPNRKRST